MAVTTTNAIERSRTNRATRRIPATRRPQWIRASTVAARPQAGTSCASKSTVTSTVARSASSSSVASATSAIRPSILLPGSEASAKDTSKSGCSSRARPARARPIVGHVQLQHPGPVEIGHGQQGLPALDGPRRQQLLEIPGQRLAGDRAADVRSSRCCSRIFAVRGRPREQLLELFFVGGQFVRVARRRRRRRCVLQSLGLHRGQLLFGGLHLASHAAKFQVQLRLAQHDQRLARRAPAGRDPPATRSPRRRPRRTLRGASAAATRRGPRRQNRPASGRGRNDRHDRRQRPASVLGNCRASASQPTPGNTRASQASGMCEWVKALFSATPLCRRDRRHCSRRSPSAAGPETVRPPARRSIRRGRVVRRRSRRDSGTTASIRAWLSSR